MRTVTPANAIEVLGEHLIPDLLPLVVDLERSQGNRLFDSRSGRSYLDCKTYVASNPVGHNHPKLNDAAFEKKLLRVAKSKPANSDFCTVELAEFAATFADIAMPEELQHAFFIEGGALAIENALKAAFDWKVQLNLKRGKKGKRGGDLGSQVIHFQEAFHGRSGYTLSLTNTADPRKYKWYPKFDWPRILNPKIVLPLNEKNLRDVIEREALAVAAIRKAFEAAPDDIAAIIIEPIQSEGGDNHFRPEFHQSLRSLADEFEAMLIYDEVQTGVGLTGKMWAYQHYGIVPDLIGFGKKMQIGGMLASSRIDEVERNVFVEPSRINSTWGGSLVDMVRCGRYLEIIRDDGLVENARIVGDYLLLKLEALVQKFPALLSNARGKGLLCAFDVVTPERREEFVERVMENGALVLRCGTQTVRVRPALIFGKSEADELVDIFEASAKQLR